MSDIEIAGIEIAGRVDKDGHLELGMEAIDFTVYRWLDKDDAIELIKHLQAVFDIDPTPKKG